MAWSWLPTAAPRRSDQRNIEISRSNHDHVRPAPRHRGVLRRLPCTAARTKTLLPASSPRTWCCTARSAMSQLTGREAVLEAMRGRRRGRGRPHLQGSPQRRDPPRRVLPAADRRHGGRRDGLHPARRGRQDRRGDHLVAPAAVRPSRCRGDLARSPRHAALGTAHQRRVTASALTSANAPMLARPFAIDPDRVAEPTFSTEAREDTS